jgi:hypothetical protein
MATINFIYFLLCQMSGTGKGKVAKVVIRAVQVAILESSLQMNCRNRMAMAEGITRIRF